MELAILPIQGDRFYTSILKAFYCSHSLYHEYPLDGCRKPVLDMPVQRVGAGSKWVGEGLSTPDCADGTRNICFACGAAGLDAALMLRTQFGSLASLHHGLRARLTQL